MKFSENWLRTFVNPGFASAELAAALVKSGIDVETVEPAAPPFDKVVVAEVLDVQRHPNADRLTVCRVNAGGAPLTVVCGAPNVRSGIRAPLARAGARLPGMEIKQAAVRGVESSGMLCSAKELGMAEDAAGLMILPADAPVGADLREYLDLDDQLFTIKPTPNRGDCLSLSGVARETAAITGCPWAPVYVEPVPAAVSERIEIVLENGAACPRYCGRIVRGVNARAATPRWMVQRLERSGLRSISAVVDVTNYVMLELGQPLHAFDRARIVGSIRVRFGHKDEKLRLLNDQEIALEANLLVIADDDKPLALAGIMGGTASAVSLDTTDILLESAFFDPAVIAGKARVLGFGSDSSYRFERGVDYAGTARALERATRLVLEICGGSAGPLCEASAALPQRPPVRLRPARAQRLLGIALGSPQIGDVLRRLDFAFNQDGVDFVVTPPSYRFDLALEVDLIEEVARIHGYDQIPASHPGAPAAMLPATEVRVSTRTLRRLMVARDYQEIISYSFVDRGWEKDFCGNAEPIALANPIAAHLSVMRSSLIGSLVECLRLNLSRQQERVRLFEIGRCYSRGKAGYSQATMLGGLAYGGTVTEQWGAAARKVDFYDMKSDVEVLAGMRGARFEPAQHPALHPARSAKLTLGGVLAGWIGELHPELTVKYNLPFPPIVFEINLDYTSSMDLACFSDYSRQPAVRRDISVEVAESVSASAMLAALKNHGSSIVSEVALFDVYRGKGIDSDKKSVAFRVLLQDTEKTLTDVEAETAIQQLLKVLQEYFSAKLRT